MLRLTQLSNHAIALLGQLAENRAECRCSARDLADKLNLPMTTTAKILKSLTREGLLISHRGTLGGYELAKTPTEITIAEIVAALEGPIQTCRKSGVAGEFVHQAIVRALEQISLYEMAAQFSQQEVKNEESPEVLEEDNTNG
jgi:Rrf2 family protein